MLTLPLIERLQSWSCSDIAFICPCLKNPTFARSCHTSFRSSECLVHRCKSVLKRSHACVQLLIVFFDSSATFGPSDVYSLSSKFWSKVSAVSTEVTSSVRRFTVLGASLRLCRSLRRSRIPCNAGTVTPTTLAAMLRGSAIG